MDKYIATRPLRFDRDYKIGELIPAAVVDPRAAKRLIDAKKIAPLPKEAVPPKEPPRTKPKGQAHDLQL